MKQEEEAVETDEVEDASQRHPELNGQGAGMNGVVEADEEALWADEDMDDDVQGWKLKIVVGLEDDE